MLSGTGTTHCSHTDGIGSDDWFLQMQALKDFGRVI